MTETWATAENCNHRWRYWELEEEEGGGRGGIIKSQIVIKRMCVGSWGSSGPTRETSLVYKYCWKLVFKKIDCWSQVQYQMEPQLKLLTYAGTSTSISANSAEGLLIKLITEAHTKTAKQKKY